MCVYYIDQMTLYDGHTNCWYEGFIDEDGEHNTTILLW
jgi:hypothetical protein